MIKILEFSCFYGYISWRKDSLKRVYDEKKICESYEEIQTTVIWESSCDGSDYVFNRSSLSAITKRFTESIKI
jgi:hypothetical protein